MDNHLRSLKMSKLCEYLFHPGIMRHLCFVTFVDQYVHFQQLHYNNQKGVWYECCMHYGRFSPVYVTSNSHANTEEWHVFP